MTAQNTVRKALVVYNPLAGRGHAAAYAIKAKTRLQQHSWQVLDVLATEYAGHLETVLAPTWGAQVELIVLVGGDGTLRELVAGLRSAKLQVELAFIPLGNANVVAREFNIPLQPEQALELLSSDCARRVDLGILRQAQHAERVFLAMLEIGFGAKIVSYVATLRQGALKNLYRWWGDLVYVIAALMALKGSKRGLFNATLDGTTRYHGVTHGVIANMQTYAKGWSLTPDALPDDGLLASAISPNNTNWSLIRTFMAAAQKRRLRATLMHYQQAKEVVISSQQPLFMQMDGDPVPFSGDATITIEPGAFTIRVGNRKQL